MLQAWETPRIQNLHFGKPIPKRESQNQIMPSCSFIGSSKKKHGNSWNIWKVHLDMGQIVSQPKWPFHLCGTVLKKSSVLTQPISRNHCFTSFIEIINQKHESLHRIGYIYIAIFTISHLIKNIKSFHSGLFVKIMVPPRHQLRGTSWSEPSSAWQWKWT